MPVLILASPSQLPIARGLGERLVAEGGEVRCYLEEDDFELNSMGCKIAVGPLDDFGNVEGAMFNAHTFMPLLPNPLVIADEAGADQVGALGEGLADAASRSNVEQTVLALSCVSRCSGPIGRAYARVADAFRDKVDPLCVVVTGLIDDPQHPLPTSATPPDQAGESRIPVVGPEELIEVLVAADSREGLSGTWELGGRRAAVSPDGRISAVEEVVAEGVELSNSAKELAEAATQRSPRVD